jgi:transcriptional regulator with XRE-family HTH domain
MENLNKLIGERIAKLRKENHMTQAMLAEKLNISDIVVQLNVVMPAYLSKSLLKLPIYSMSPLTILFLVAVLPINILICFQIL